MADKPTDWTKNPHVPRRQFLKTAAGLVAAGSLSSRRGQAEESQSPRNSDRILPKGTLVLMGGEVEGKEADLLRQGCSLQGGALKGQTVVCVVSAHKDPQDCERYANEVFKKQLGAEKVAIIETRDDANDSDKLKAIKEARIVRFIGGKQDKLVEAFADTEAHKEILRRYAADPDFIVIGNSAGTAAMSKHMLCRNEETGKDEVLAGLGLLDLVIFDMHMVRGRLKRLQEAVAAVSKSIQSCIGLGVDEGTALVIKGGKADVHGEGRIYVVGPEDHAIEPSAFRLVSQSNAAAMESRAIYPSGSSFKLGEYAMVVPLRGKPMDQAISAGR